MSLSIGIVGLPNVGKSTLFTALTRKTGLAANYPFATISPNVGVVPVSDPRLDRLAEIVRPERVVPAAVEFVDIAGLVRGASTGSGLGNQFLANIRETDAVVEVVRYFSDPDVAHVDGRIDPLGDATTIATELILADFATVDRALMRFEKDAKRDPALETRVRVVRRLHEWLAAGNRAIRMVMTPEERALTADLHLLTAKPFMYIANVDEERIHEPVAPIDGVEPVVMCAKIEAELAELGEDEAVEYLRSIGLPEPGLVTLARRAYTLLGLESFFTAGEREVRAWTVPAGATAPQAAGRIHTDFERGFIKAEVVAFEDYDRYGGEANVRAAGRLRVEGREYVVKDGDVIHFRFNV